MLNTMVKILCLYDYVTEVQRQQDFANVKMETSNRAKTVLFFIWQKMI